MDTRERSLAHSIRLEYFTVAWNLVEAGVGFAAGAAAGSVALVGFALDSLIESSSGGVLLWRLHSESSGRTPEDAERIAVRGVAIAFLALAGYVGVRSVVALASGAHPDGSIPGVVLAAASLVAMPLLAWRKRAAARELDSRAMQADAKQTTICTYLSAVLLAGLVANAVAGWWWADPAVGIVVATVAAREGVELWRTKDLCCI